MRDQVYIINEAPISMQKDYLNKIFHSDMEYKSHKNELLVRYGWEEDGPEGHGFYIHPMQLNKEEYEMIAEQT